VTALQMKYLLAYLNLRENERSVTSVAIETGVNKSTVSRVFTLAIKEGILDERHQVTEKGREKVEQFSMKLREVIELLCNLGIEEKRAIEEAYQMIGACSDGTIQAILEKWKELEISCI